VLRAKVSHLPVRMFDLEGRRQDRSQGPFALDSEGNIYATIYDGKVASIAIYSGATGKRLRTVGPLGGRLEPDDYQGHHERHRGIAVAADGTIFAASRTGILMFSAAQGAPLGTLSVPKPRGICLDGQGNLYAAYDGGLGDPYGQLNLVQSGDSKRVAYMRGVGVAVDQAGNIYILNAGGHITVYDAQGQQQRYFGNSVWSHNKHREGTLTEPSSIAIDSKGNIAVTEPFQSRVQVFDLRGNVKVLGGLRQGDGRCSSSIPGIFNSPVGVAFAADDSLYVLDDGRVQVFSPDMLSTGVFGFSVPAQDGKEKDESTAPKSDFGGLNIGKIDTAPGFSGFSGLFGAPS
jgi:hypothetical protein